MNFRPTFVLFLPALIGPLAAGAAAAQSGTARRPPRPFMAIAERDLTFGQVLPGLPTSVSAHDPRHSGLFELQGTPGGPVRIELLLPSDLISAQGALLPIAFTAGDGFADFSRGRPPRGTRFDPRIPLVAMLGPNGRLWVRLGGTVSPRLNQAGGAYRATISLTVFDLGT